MMMRAWPAGLLAIGLALGCGAHAPPHDDTTATLAIDPPNSDLTILNGAPAMEAFHASLVYPDGTSKDVTADAQFSIDISYGSFAANTLAMTGGGKTTVIGLLGSKVAQAQVIGHVKTVRVDPGVPPNAADWFNGPEDPSRAPRVVYPAADVVMPRNLGDFEVHWTDASTNDVFELSLVTEFADIRAYVKGGNGVAAAGPDPSWSAFLASEWIGAVGDSPAVTFQVRGVQSANPIAVGSAPPQLVRLSNEPMLGGLYYWASTSSNGVYGIYRHDMSKPGQPAKQFMTTAQTPGGKCVACHVLSRDGKNMAVTFDGGDGAATMIDVATATLQPTTQAWNFGTFTPDGLQFLSVHDGVLVVRDYATQATLATMPASGWVTHPDLSPDGTQLVYVHPTTTSADWAFGGGKIYVRSYDATTHAFGPERALVSDASNNYYPTFSPDGAWILFNKSADNSTSGAYNNVSAALWVVKADGSAPPIELAKLDLTAGLTNSWGRWAPFAQTFGAGNEPMYWVTVSSKRDFGVRLVAAKQPQIWMTPFFPARAAAGHDPSTTAFRLPFQDITSNNHIAQWTEQVVGVQ